MIKLRICALLLAGTLAQGALAQSTAPTFEFNFLKIEGLIIGAPFALDDAYEKAAGRAIPTRLKMIIPTAKDTYRILVDNQPSGGMVKINFATPDQTLIDSVHIIDATIPMQAMDKRLAQFAGLLKDSVYPISVDGMADAKLLALRNQQMGKYATVELIATYTDPEIGPMYLRILGVPHPDKAESIFIIINVNAQLEPLDNLDQFAQTLSGKTVNSITFTQ